MMNVGMRLSGQYATLWPNFIQLNFQYWSCPNGGRCILYGLVSITILTFAHHIDCTTESNHQFNNLSTVLSNVSGDVF